MIDVEHRPLRALKQIVLPMRHRIRQQRSRIAHQRFELLRQFLDANPHSRVVHAVRQLERSRQRLLVFYQGVVQLMEAFRIVQIRDANPAAPDLIFVARANAPRRRANRNAIFSRFRHLLHQAMDREDHLRTVADAQLFSYVDARGLQHGHFFGQCFQVHHDAVADHGHHAGAQNPAGDQFQNEFLGPDINGMPRIVPALIARHNIEPLCEQVHNFAFTLVTPLGPEHNHIGHFMFFDRAPQVR